MCGVILSLNIFQGFMSQGFEAKTGRGGANLKFCRIKKNPHKTIQNPNKKKHRCLCLNYPTFIKHCKTRNYVINWHRVLVNEFWGHLCKSNVLHRDSNPDIQTRSSVGYWRGEAWWLTRVRPQCANHVRVWKTKWYSGRQVNTFDTLVSELKWVPTK